MNETYLGSIPAVGVGILVLASWFYMWGGRSGKWKRRFIGSLLCATALWVEAALMGVFQWIMLLIYPLTSMTFHLGYGSDVLLTKVMKRLIVVCASLVTGVGMCILLGGRAWLILPVEMVIGATTIWLGTKNPIQAAPEEFFICLFLWTPKLMYPFIGG